MEEHPSEHIYADASKIDQHMGFILLFQNDTYCGQLRGKAAIFYSRNVCHKNALTKILEEGKWRLCHLLRLLKHSTGHGIRDMVLPNG